ncbi:MAG: DUF5615 family PIN-like protein [Desulfobacterales bacterium]|nr:DUF5615 family PIN-like protein [Desulfobacterales bacterium]
MRILADENVHVDIIRGLRQAGFEVLSVVDKEIAPKPASLRFGRILSFVN